MGHSLHHICLLITFDVFKYYKSKDAATREEGLLITFDVFKLYKRDSSDSFNLSLLITFDVFK